MGVEEPVVILGFNAIDLPCLVVVNAPLRRKRVESIPFKVFQHMTLGAMSAANGVGRRPATHATVRQKMAAVRILFLDLPASLTPSRGINLGHCLELVPKVQIAVQPASTTPHSAILVSPQVFLHCSGQV